MGLRHRMAHTKLQPDRLEDTRAIGVFHAAFAVSRGVHQAITKIVLFIHEQRMVKSGGDFSSMRQNPCLSMHAPMRERQIKIYSQLIAYIVPTVILTKSWPEFSLLTLTLTPPSHYRTDTETFSLFPHYSSNTHLVSVFPSKIYISMRFLQIFLPNK